MKTKKLLQQNIIDLIIKTEYDTNQLMRIFNFANEIINSDNRRKQIEQESYKFSSEPYDLMNLNELQLALEKANDDIKYYTDDCKSHRDPDYWDLIDIHTYIEQRIRKLSSDEIN